MNFLLPRILDNSSDEEENEFPRIRTFRPRKNPFDDFDDVDFKDRFRLSKNSVTFLLQEIIDRIHQPLHRRNMPVSPINQLLVTLRFYATGNIQLGIGDYFNISQSTICRIIPRITRLICDLSQNYIKLPRTQEAQRNIAENFYKIAGFPGIIGALDCTHIRIESPGGEQAELFRNRKGYFSINVQAVCDADLIIRDIVARWPGSVHDMTIFNDSILRARLENNEFRHYILLGDNGYACKRYLLTPLLNPISPSEIRYNNSQIKTRNTIERTFGVLKRRFPCLSIGMRIKVEKTLEVIVATSVLHNICRQVGDQLPADVQNIPDEVPENLNEGNGIANQNRNDNTAVRTSIINTVFS